MVQSKQKLFSDTNISLTTKEEQRLKVLLELNLRRSETIPVFEEATQTAAHFLAAEISILGFIDQELHWFKSSIGLSRLGLMNDLAQTRQLPRRESFCSQVVENAQLVVINDTKDITDPVMSASKLVLNYGIRSYLGVPLIDAEGNCLGALAVMDRKPRNFAERDVEFLQIIARWCMSEFERNRLLQNQQEKISVRRTSSLSLKAEKINSPILEKDSEPTKLVKLQLLEQLTQELRTPLTSVLGMASVLGREIYGTLTTKQKEYVEIIQHSGRYLLSLINEITELGVIDEGAYVLNLVSVDIEMLCQQAIKTLEEIASRREQDIRLSIEPGRSRIFSLDKDKVRQMVYHLVFSVIQLSATGSIVRIHISYKQDTLCITVWVSHPWLGDGITEVDTYFHINTLPMMEIVGDAADYKTNSETRTKLSTTLEKLENLSDNHSDIIINDLDEELAQLSNNLSREKLGLLLSCRLAELHGGEVVMQGSTNSGYRYVLSLPIQLPTPSQVFS
ncbi:GAF domain-containing sensor histidine kinase [Cronbergia sp. UHCC 0137]|uniref:GAF domain-containing sensor histidine kinase n=1 Tax=Cronbergia sp. UHCC 0137 TaxID=3110239 RepID=UPI002B1F1DAD|nr:GAF domain-containing sensor histidine kinase [Cronbergia sp. UHCC 0137]MEA5618100.1 GAF domain-containing sensor histidine kinase [Cronbergia sp. UHCC 0137]